MRTPSDRLFRLVHALSRAEKRYFKLWAAADDERPAMFFQLFDAVNEQSEPDEKKLIRKIYGSEPFDGKKFLMLKSFLYDQILKALEDFDERSQVEHQLRHWLQAVAALFRRGLYEDCRELLEKAKKVAARWEFFPAQLEIFRWEKQIAYTEMDVDRLHRDLQKLDFEESKCLRQLENLAEHRRLFLQIWMSSQTDSMAARADDRLEKIKNLAAENALLQNPDLALSHRARVLFYRSRSIFCYQTLDYEAFLETCRQLIALQKAHPHFLEEDVSEHIAALSNAILAAGLLGRYDEVRVFLADLEAVRPITRDDATRIGRRLFTTRILLAIFTGAFEAGRLEIEKMEAAADPSEREIYRSAGFRLQFFSVYFGCGDLDRALDFLNEQMTQKKTVRRPDLQAVFRILELVAHFEKGNMELLASLVRTAYRFLRSHERMFELEKRFLSAMAEAVKAASKSDQKVIFEKLRADFSAFSARPEGRILLQYFDLEAWIDSRIRGVSFSKAVQQKQKLEK